MEWMNRAGRPAQGSGQTVNPTANANVGVSNPGRNTHDGNKKKNDKDSKFSHISTVVLLFSITLLTVAVIGFVMFYKGKSESRYVAKDKLQAVFLNGGQVYFGNIRELNDKFVGLTNIYYLRVNQQVQPKAGEASEQDISLVKLGCELHGPQDQMLINREQVVFWENLKTDGQVAKAVEQYKTANPNGQKCDNNEQNQQSNGQQNTPANTNQGNNQNNQNNENPAPTTP